MIEVFNYLKVAEGGPDTPGMVKALRRAGIKAKLGRSVYIGNVALMVEARKKTSARKTLRKAGFEITW